MSYLVGIVLGLVVGGFAKLLGFDRDRSFYPTVLIVIASYYSLFAVMGGSLYPPLVVELTAGLAFLAWAVVGFATRMWLVAAGIAGHGVFDFFIHPFLAHNPGMPEWWPSFCGSIDIVIGGWLAFWLWRTARTDASGA